VGGLTLAVGYRGVVVDLREVVPRADLEPAQKEHPDDPEWWVSHETIYQTIYVQPNGDLRTQMV